MGGGGEKRSEKWKREREEESEREVERGSSRNDPECTTYDHPNYGYSGQCIATSECPGAKYISNLCPNFPNDVKCCFTVGSDNECVTHNHATYGQVGHCVDKSECPFDNYISNKCPTKPDDIKCCFFKPGTISVQSCETYYHSFYGTTGSQCMAASSDCPGGTAKTISGKCSGYTCCLTATSDSECVNSGGFCIDTSNCPNANYTSGYCPTKPNNVKCCHTTPDPCDQYTSVTRSGWGARDPSDPHTTISTPVEYVFIHHTVTSECSTQSACSTTIQGIQNYHMDDKEWKDIGYSFLAGGDGQIYEGRGWDKEGAHTAGYNSVGLAFSFIGDFSSKLPDTAALKAVANAIQCGVKNGYIQSNYKLRGHKQMGTNTFCPGNKLYGEIVQKWPNWA
ncbi:uncharacterized protein [Amphiura filiformis]|uniref:uncharacterized protein n=1 Tax=Amphiura filiformis TaxID=82378 RepID=UPI003B225A05